MTSTPANDIAQPKPEPENSPYNKTCIDTSRLEDQYEFYMLMKQPLTQYLYEDPDNIHCLQSMHKPTFALYQDEEAFHQAMKNILYTDQTEKEQEGKQAEIWKKLQQYHQDFSPEWQEYLDPGIDKRYWTELWAAAFEGIQKAAKEQTNISIKPSFQVFVRRLHHEKKECDRLLKAMHETHQQVYKKDIGNQVSKTLPRDSFNSLVIKVITDPSPSIQEAHKPENFEDKVDFFAESIQNEIVTTKASNKP